MSAIIEIVKAASVSDILAIIGVTLIACIAVLLVLRGPRVTIHRRDDKGPWG